MVTPSTHPASQLCHPRKKRLRAAEQDRTDVAEARRAWADVVPKRDGG